MIKLTKEQIILLHTQLIQETGGSDGIHDEGLPESALHVPFQSYAGTDSFPSIQQKAARLSFGLVKNYAFIDGNKRIGAHAMLVFLALNRIELKYTQEDMSVIILKIAASELPFEGLLQWIIGHHL